MGIELGKSEEIRKLNEATHFLSSSGDLCLALITDRELPSPEFLAACLGPDEQAEARLKTSAPAHRAWLLGRLAAKAAAEKKWGLPPARTQIVKGPEGRPLLKSPALAGETGLISISHTAGAAAALASEVPAGLDLEKKGRQLGRRVELWTFDENERSLAASSGLGPFPGPLSLWCAREAAAKSWGLALLNCLEKVRVIRADWSEGHLTVNWLGPEKRSSDVRLMFFDDYLLAVATAT